MAENFLNTMLWYGNLLESGRLEWRTQGNNIRLDLSKTYYESTCNEDVTGSAMCLMVGFGFSGV